MAPPTELEHAKAAPVAKRTRRTEVSVAVHDISLLWLVSSWRRAYLLHDSCTLLIPPPPCWASSPLPPGHDSCTLLIPPPPPCWASSPLPPGFLLGHPPLSLLPFSPLHALHTKSNPSQHIFIGLQIGTWTPRTSAVHKAYRRTWGISVKQHDPAYVWAQWLSPVYSISLGNTQAAFGLQTSGALAAGVAVDGILVRDLQLPEAAKHAYVLRPLPARAKRLTQFISHTRRHMLGIVATSPAKEM
jgi:hypothetical protein